jgi:hypothetical protein
MFQDEIVIFTRQGENGVNDHSVFRTSDNKELCRIRLGWEKERLTEV